MIGYDAKKGSSVTTLRLFGPCIDNFVDLSIYVIFIVCFQLCVVRQTKWGRLDNNNIYKIKTKIDNNVPNCFYYYLLYTCGALHVSTFPRSLSGESQEYQFLYNKY
jgi:hypothetical protein